MGPPYSTGPYLTSKRTCPVCVSSTRPWLHDRSAPQTQCLMLTRPSLQGWCFGDLAPPGASSIRRLSLPAQRHGLFVASAGLTRMSCSTWCIVGRAASAPGCTKFTFDLDGLAILTSSTTRLDRHNSGCRRACFHQNRLSRQAGSVTFIVDAAVLCGAERSCNDWRWQRARMESDLILRKLSLNSRANVSVQGRSKYEVSGIHNELDSLVSGCTCGHILPRVVGFTWSAKISQRRSQRCNIAINKSPSTSLLPPNMHRSSMQSARLSRTWHANLDRHCGMLMFVVKTMSRGK
jgi:hypothetical protein